MNYNPNSKKNLRAGIHDNKIECRYCGKKIISRCIDKHEIACKKKEKKCPVCFKLFYTGNDTCGYSCANTYFRSGSDNPNWKESQYRSTCFEHHEKKCVICGEDLIVAVHHFNHDADDNSPENLIPMCPTHHQYWHSRYKHLIEEKVIKYHEEFMTKY